MIRSMLALLPAGSAGRVARHLVLTTLGVILRAAGVVLLIPLIAALFSEDPAVAWPWAGLLAVVTVAGWFVDWAATQLAYRLGFGILDNGQRTLADRIIGIRLNWFTAEHTATTRQAVATTGPDLVGVIVYFVTPLLSAILLPLVIALVLVPIAWQLGVAALVGIVVLFAAFWVSGRLGRAADRAAERANTSLTERVLEFARTQQALRAARRVEPARSHAGAALATAHNATMKTLLLQIPGQLLFGLASQLALLALAGTAVILTIQGALSIPQAIALIVVIVRYLESFTVFAELSPGSRRSPARCAASAKFSTPRGSPRARPRWRSPVHRGSNCATSTSGMAATRPTDHACSTISISFSSPARRPRSSVHPGRARAPFSPSLPDCITPTPGPCS